MNDKIEVYKDQVLLDLTQEMAMLQSEEVGFFLSKLDVDEKGRTMKDVAQDMIAIYEKTNLHLKNKYPDNTVAISWIGTNETSASLLREKF